MDSTLDLLKRLNDHGVRYVLVGGMAGVVYGSGLVTQDIDVCVPLTPENVSNILSALRGLNPRFRMRPDRPPLPDDPARLIGFKNLYMATDLGQIDFLSEITGVGAYEEVRRHSNMADLGGITCRVLDLESLIQAKKALGRPRDLQAAAELEAIRERLRDKRQGSNGT